MTSTPISRTTSTTATAVGPARGSTSDRWSARAGAVGRIAVGLFFVSAGLPKLAEPAVWAADFARWNVPLPELAVYGVGALEVAGGLALALGVTTRAVAALLAAAMAGALLTAGVADGCQHLVLPPVLGLTCALVALRGGGAWQLRPGAHSPRRRLRR